MSFYKICLVPLIILAGAGCKKLVSIQPPQTTIVASQVFSTDAQATSAMAGVYYNFVNAGDPPVFGNGGITLFTGLSSDEFLVFNTSTTAYFQFYQNQIQPTNSGSAGSLWAIGFSSLYQANAVLSGLLSGTGLHDSVKMELEGEAKFMRALINFYLTNLYGDIPLVTSINWQTTNLLAKSPPATIYQSILSDLSDAARLLPPDYSVGSNERIIPNRYAATALMARVYLYLGNWAAADSTASAVINSGLFSLEPDPANVFLANSAEAIFQLKQDNSTFSYNATEEGNYFIPYSDPSYTAPPPVYLTQTILNAFDSGDNRKSAWIDSVTFNNQVYYFPYKYKAGPVQEVANATRAEYYMVLRMAEQYLIRAEADANGTGGGLAAAVTDLNTVRRRAGLSVYTGPVTSDSVFAAIRHERQVELFAEWGHRWLDLKRWGTGTQVLTATKGFAVSASSLLYPIPTGDLVDDPNLTQNPGY